MAGFALKPVGILPPASGPIWRQLQSQQDDSCLPVRACQRSKQLDVSDNGDDFAGSMKVLVTSVWDGLQELNLAESRMTGEDRQHLRLANWPHLTNTKIFCTMPHRGMADLAAAKLPSLAQLDLRSHTMLDDDF